MRLSGWFAFTGCSLASVSSNCLLYRRQAVASESGQPQSRVQKPLFTCLQSITMSLAATEDVMMVRGKASVNSTWCAAIEAKKQGIAGNPEWGKLPEEGEVDILHASPPCQELSSLNQHTDALKAERVLYPLLDQVGPSSRHQPWCLHFWTAILCFCVGSEHLTCLS